ncbi:unnamed protein product [Bursaphelenchus xylophilus]|uniref:(pine wood nematode) hypothetical protein n=1 Tax=Bursaphelenchus xylophilus TaxID=6326 RepID=A0A1I7S2Z2_BURXY|nr:unnamed protein product [Bursaphelenchus xylophilus]CAG9116037.1 unnamed protein product [Bursaphelenchus xylophilus]
MRLFFGLLLLTHLGLADVIPRTSYYTRDRVFQCINYAPNVTRCSLKEEGRNTELNPGCFEEQTEKNETRVYCRLNCEESDETTVLAKIPGSNHKCNNFFTYHLERRRRDWYIWRSGECISTTISFEIRCGFPKDPRQFYAQYKQLFEYDEGDVPVDTDAKRRS